MYSIAQTNLADAQRAEISALTEYQIALVDLAYATGTLLGAAKVQWAPFVPEEEMGDALDYLDIYR